MNPILCRSELTYTSDYTKLGIGVLKDCESCHVVEERNGNYFLEMSYPVGGVCWDKIVPGQLIKAIPSEGADEQLFRITAANQTLKGRIAVTAEHVSLLTKHMIVKPFSGQYTASAYMAAMTNNIADVWTSISYQKRIQLVCSGSSSTAKAGSIIPRTLYDSLIGAKGSMTDIWGVEFSYEDYGYTIRAHTAASPRGRVLSEGIRYGANMTNLEIEKAIKDRYSACYGYYYDEQTGTYVDTGAGINSGAHIPNFIPRCKIVDFTSDYSSGTVPTVAELREKAQAYVAANGSQEVDFSAKVSFVPTWNALEAVQLPKSQISLCDTVPVIYEKYGITLTAKVITTDFNVLTERYNSIEVGTAKKPLGKLLAQTVKAAGISVYS